MQNRVATLAVGPVELGQQVVFYFSAIFEQPFGRVFTIVGDIVVPNIRESAPEFVGSWSSQPIALNERDEDERRENDESRARPSHVVHPIAIVPSRQANARLEFMI